MVVSGQEVLEALERVGFQVERRFDRAAVMVRDHRIVLVTLTPVLDQEALASVLLNSGLSAEQLLSLLERETTRDVHNESHVREKRSS